MRSSQPGWRGASRANASTSRSKPFWRVSRPAATTTCDSGSRAAAAQRGHRVGDALHARARAVEQRGIVGEVALAQHRERVEPAVAAAEVRRERRPVRAEVHVLLADDERAGRVAAAAISA